MVIGNDLDTLENRWIHKKETKKDTNIFLFVCLFSNETVLLAYVATFPQKIANFITIFNF